MGTEQLHWWEAKRKAILESNDALLKQRAEKELGDPNKSPVLESTQGPKSTRPSPTSF